MIGTKLRVAPGLIDDVCCLLFGEQTSQVLQLTWSMPSFVWGQA